MGLHVNIVPDPLAPEDEGLLLFPQEGARPLSPFGRIVVQSVDPTAAVAQGLRAAARAEQERGRRFPVRHLAQLTGAMWTGGYEVARVILCLLGT